jgi:hypothetical protein
MGPPVPGRTVASRVAALLLRIEWAGKPPVCPCCGGPKTRGHLPDCELISLIGETAKDGVAQP